MSNLQNPALFLIRNSLSATIKRSLAARRLFAKNFATTKMLWMLSRVPNENEIERLK